MHPVNNMCLLILAQISAYIKKRASFLCMLRMNLVEAISFNGKCFSFNYICFGAPFFWFFLPSVIEVSEYSGIHHCGE